MSFHSLKISTIVSETSDAKTIYFEIPAHLRDQFQHKPGQYLTLKTIINGKEVRRAYSICTPPETTDPGVTIKKVSKGTMSVYLNDKVKPGDFLDVMAPEGHFTIVPDHLKSRDHYFITAGSGITPVMSMIQSILENEPKSSCFLLYGNRNEDSVIFKNALEKLAVKYMDQLHVTHVLSQPSLKKSQGLHPVISRRWVAAENRLITCSN